MGTHYYVVGVTPRIKGEPPEERLELEPYSRKRYDIAKFPTEARPSGSGYTCREFAFSSLGLLITSSFPENSKRDLVFGIRCFGEMYTKISHMFTDKKDVTKISKFLSEIMGVKFRLKFHVTKSQNELPTDLRLRFLGGTKPLDGYVDIYINSWENRGVNLMNNRMSAICAILRESRIMNGIVTGTIHDKESFMGELLRISNDRRQKNDDSYDCYTLTQFSNYARYQIMESIKVNLAGFGNTDGSDHYSMFKLAVFINFADKFPDLSISTYNGPASFARSTVNEKSLKEFKKVVKFHKLPLVTLKLLYRESTREELR